MTHTICARDGHEAEDQHCQRNEDRGLRRREQEHDNCAEQGGVEEGQEQAAGGENDGALPVGEGGRVKERVGAAHQDIEGPAHDHRDENDPADDPEQRGIRRRKKSPAFFVKNGASVSW